MLDNLSTVRFTRAAAGGRMLFMHPAGFCLYDSVFTVSRGTRAGPADDSVHRSMDSRIQLSVAPALRRERADFSP
ncbi:Uncharacterised protein [Amycolatopsis camponoti]|uniref:Uncharacterized protein n=1 Tax=Amycolatopsis camponoti TaxID=2606593 RepID=A0A6I8LGM5_9PSEU|nr:Uncharacterised protein [Amycolatopsis camponoti]